MMCCRWIFEISPRVCGFYLRRPTLLTPYFSCNIQCGWSNKKKHRLIIIIIIIISRLFFYFGELLPLFFFVFDFCVCLSDDSGDLTWCCWITSFSFYPYKNDVILIFFLWRSDVIGGLFFAFIFVFRRLLFCPAAALFYFIYTYI